jgi:hypothetical protein
MTPRERQNQRAYASEGRIPRDYCYGSTHCPCTRCSELYDVSPREETRRTFEELEWLESRIYRDRLRREREEARCA